MGSTMLTKQMKLQKWSEIFQMHKASGLTISEYCRENAIQPSKYYYWLKRVRQASCDPLPTSLYKPTNPIVPMTFEAPAENIPCSTYTMRIAMRGVTIEFTNEATQRLMESALQVLNHVR